MKGVKHQIWCKDNGAAVNVESCLTLQNPLFSGGQYDQNVRNAFERCAPSDVRED